MHRLSKFALAIAPLAVGGCMTAPPAPAGITLAAALTGRAEVPSGDPDGSGNATVTVDPAHGQACYTLTVAGIAPAMAAHIHKGAAGTAGPPVAPLTAPSTGSSSGCVAVDPAVASDMIANPGGYYVNVHNSEFPGGAVRGQLSR